ncbi:unnamed protein product [Chilo suppressalis]|uniref:Uncharacterized protein n=1 Tax=Chilo suppressalis TaxID=168631 RepID=A0ABN8BF39_CHISP|nr:hypothetical protein evm_009735 [Chilo suppressalis]CAH0407744.1 unnamed protein product [Chilo suppressalis]
MKFVVLALCVYAVSGATIGNTAFRPWQNPAFVRTTQTGGYAKATAQVSVPATQVVQETVVPAVEVTKTVVEPVQKVAKVAVPVVQQTKIATPVVQSRVAATAGITGKYATPYVPVEGVNKDVKAETLRSETEVFPDGFQYTYETSNGISAASNGELKKVNNVDTLVVRGQYQYVSSEGVPITVTYIADENGYQPQSDVLPVAPPVPVAIARAVEYLRTHAPKTETVKNY